MEAPLPVKWTPLEDLRERIRGLEGRDPSLLDEGFVRACLQRRILATSVEGLDDYLRLLGEDPGEKATFLQSLDNHHSLFFRDPLTFAVLEQQVLPRLAVEKAGRSEIRVWSAGCASGEEAWSLAILLTELAEGRDHPVPFRLFATDFSAPQVEAARLGSYERCKLRNVRMEHLNRWFTPVGSSYSIQPSLAAHVDFSVHDLLNAEQPCPPASIFGGFDLVFCCNLLMYYRPSVRHLLCERLLRSLTHGGILVMGESERGYFQERGSGVYMFSVPFFRAE